MVHDKAKWHFEGKFPPDLDRRQAYVPGGLVVAWLAKRGLLSKMAEREFAPELARLRSRSITGPEAYRLLGGVLASDLLDPEADAFLAEYLDPDRGGYWADYGRLAAGLPSEYHLPDAWASSERLEPLIETSFSRWQARTSRPT